MNASRYLSALGLLTTLLLAAPAAAGDKEAAKALFDKGLKHMAGGRYDQGCPALAESYRLDPYPGTLFTLAECEAKLGRLATAVTRYEEYLALYATLPPDKKLKQKVRQDESLKKKAALELEVPQLTLVLPPSAPSGTVVKLDSAEVAPAALGTPLAVDPGEHVVTAQAPGGPAAEVTVTLGKAEKQTITLEDALSKQKALEAAEHAGQPSDPLGHTGLSTRRMGVYIAGGAGVAGLFLGSIAGGLMLSKKGVVADNCAVGVDGVARCTHDGAVAGNSAKTLGLASSIGFGVAIAGLATAAVLFFTEPSAPKAGTGRSAPSRPAKARWIGPGVLSVGREGSIFGVQGVW